jgi:multidrug resistance efflux pump
MPSSDRELRVGDTIGPNTPVVALPDFDQAMQVAATLSDVDDGHVAIGARGTCTLDAYPDEPLGCTVTTVAPVARVPVGRPTLRRSFDVTLDLAATDVSRLRAGMSFEIELRAAPVRGVVVPRGAVVRGAAGAWVVMAGGAVRDVELAACDAQQCAIASGLAAGEVVQLGGHS